MKFLVSVLLLSSLLACRQSPKGRNGVEYKNAVSYNDYIISRQGAVIKHYFDFINLSKTNLDSAASLLETSGKKIGEMVEELKGMPAYNGDSTFRDAAVNSFTFYQRIFTNEYKEVLDITRDTNQTPGLENPRLNEIIQQITREEEKLDIAFQKAQRNFVKNNNIRLVENSMQKEIDNLNK